MGPCFIYMFTPLHILTDSFAFFQGAAGGGNALWNSVLCKQRGGGGLLSKHGFMFARIRIKK